MTKIVWTDPAVQDIASIHSYITRDSIVYADALLLEIFHFVEKLEQFRSGRVVPSSMTEYQRNNCWKLSGHLRYRTFKGQDSGCFAWCRLFQNPKLVRIDKGDKVPATSLPLLWDWIYRRKKRSRCR